MSNYFKRMLSLLTAVLLTAALLPAELIPEQSVAVAASSYFTDTAGIPQEKAIDRWASLGVVTGNNGRFNPADPATRIEFYSFINRALNSTAKKNISKFLDVKNTDWYYSEVQLAYAAGLTNGVSASSFGAAQYLTREMAVTIFGRIFGMYTENTSVLSIYGDASDVTYGRGYLAAFAQIGITLLNNGNFEPNRNMTRAEAVAFIDSFFTYVYAGSDILSNKTISGNVLIRNPEVTVERMVLNGNLVLGDGVGTGNIYLRNCTINGSLIIRGGGPNSVSLSGTTVSGGVYIYNANGTTRLYNANSTSKVGQITAKTSTILEGVGSGTLYIPEDAVDNATFKLRNVALDSLNVASPSAEIALESGTVDNMRFTETAKNSTAAISSGAKVNYAEINAETVNITGSGTLDTLYVGASGARISMYPRYRYITPGLSVWISGSTYTGSTSSGSSTTGTANNVTRSDAKAAVDRDNDNTGGSGITMKTAAIYGGTEVAVTQEKSSSVPLSDNGRYGYWMGFFVPVPAKYQDPVVKVTYNFEGATDAVYSLPVERKNDVNGITLYIPVRATSSTVGDLNTTVNITWGDATYENIRFYSVGALNLTAPSTSQTSAIVGYFANTRLPSYNKITTYTGTEALKRLLLGDNPLGLDIRGYESYTENDKNTFSAQMYYDRAQLTSKAAIQKYLDGRLSSSMGALYAVNNAMSAQTVRNIVESTTYAAQLGIETSSSSAYGQLSSSGKLAACTGLLTARNKEKTTTFANEKAAADAFNAAVVAQRKVEVSALAAVNSAATGTTMKKALETKTNYEAIGIATDSAPYSALADASKLSVATKIAAARPFTTLDAVRTLFESLVGTPSNPVVVKPQDDPNILSVSANMLSLELVKDDVETIMPIVTTSSGTFSSPTSVTWSVTTGPSLVTVDALTGRVKAVSTGKAVVKIVSKTDTKKSATISITIKPSVTITALSMASSQLSVGIGSQVQARLNRTPADGNDMIKWSSDDEEIATVSEDGTITGVGMGFTNIMAQTVSGVRAVCRVFVAAEEVAVLIDKSNAKLDTDTNIWEVEIGKDCTMNLTASMSPIILANNRLTWVSSATHIVTLVSAGVVKGEAFGDSLITAESVAYPGIKDVIRVKVVPDKHGVTMSDNNLTMYKNGLFQLSATIAPIPDGVANYDPMNDLVWSVEGNRTDIVKVSDKGLVTAMAPGTAVVTATHKSESTASASCTVTVLSSDLAVTVSPTAKQTIQAGNSFFITTSFNPVPSNQKVDYTTRDPNIAKVDDYGKVTGVAKGSTIIDVVAQANGKKFSIEVAVTNVAMTGFTLQSSITVLQGSLTKLSFSFEPANTTNQNITWSSDSPNVVSISKEGYILAATSTSVTETTYTTDAKGSTTSITKTENKPVTITATPENGKPYTCKVTVIPNDGSTDILTMDIQLATWVFKVGYSQYLKVVFNGDSTSQPLNTNVSWTSSNENVAVVDSTGYMQTKGPGTTQITATSEQGGISKTKTIIVAPDGVTGISFIGLDDNANYGAWVQMSTKAIANTKTIGTKLQPEKPSNSILTWSTSEHKATNGASTVVSVVNGKLTALNPGTAKITAKSQGLTTYGSATPGSIYVNLASNGIEKRGADYYDPNGNKLNPAENIPLVVNLSTENSFMVWVTPAAPEVVSFHNMSGNIYINETANISVSVTPSDAKIDLVEWKVGGVTVATGTSLVCPIRPTTLGTVTISCAVTMNEYLGPADMNSWVGMHPNADRLALPTVTKSISQDVGIINRPMTGLSLQLPSGVTASDIYENQLPFTITAAIEPYNATNKAMTWSTDNQLVATVKTAPNGTDGEVTINGTGTVTITAKPQGSENSKFSASVTLTVKPLINPTTIMANAPTTLAVGTTATSILLFDAGGISEGYIYKGVKWTSSDITVLSVTGNSDTAVLTALKASASPVKITAECLRDSKISASFVVTVTAAAAGSAPISAPLAITIAPQQETSAFTSVVGVETQEDLNAAQFTSSNTKVATISEDGVITAVGEGETTVTGKLNGSVNTMTVKVGDIGSAAGNEKASIVPTAINLRATAKLKTGTTITLYPILTPYNADALVWSSSAPDVATVSNGVVKALKAGKTTITLASPDGKKKDTCVVTVVDTIAKAITSFKLSKTELNVNKGASSKLTAQIAPTGVTLNGVGWYSSNPTVATVDASGNVKGLAAGTVVITAVSDEGHTATCAVTVTVKVTSVKLDKTALPLKVGGGYMLTATVLPDDSTVRTVTWKTSNAAIATVDANGNVKAIKKGTATITATCDGKSVTCKVTVT